MYFAKVKGRGSFATTPTGILLDLHYLATAPGDDLTGFDVQELMADGAVDITVLFRPYYQRGKTFQFHSCLSTHDLGDGIQDLVMAATAAGGAVGNGLNFLESLFHILKSLALFQRLFHVKAANMFAVANHIVYHVTTSLKCAIT